MAYGFELDGEDIPSATQSVSAVQVGSRLNAAWIYRWLRNPQALRPGTTEPNRNMSEEDARALTAFMMSQKGSGKQEAKKR